MNDIPPKCDRRVVSQIIVVCASTWQFGYIFKSWQGVTLFGAITIHKKLLFLDR